MSKLDPLPGVQVNEVFLTALIIDIPQPEVVAPPLASVHKATAVPLIVPDVNSLLSVPCTPLPVEAPLMVGVVIVGEVSVGVVRAQFVVMHKLPVPD